MVRQASRLDLTGRRVVVTGAAVGSLGAATAAILSKWGAEVVITTRADSEAAATAIGSTVVGHPLELTDSESVAAFADWYAAQFPDGLDVLINNAGIHLDLRSKWKEPRLTPDGYEVHWRTNYLGTMDLTESLLPMLCAAGRRTGDARVVNVVSTLHNRGRNQWLFEPMTPYHSWDAYGLSKLALVHASSQLTDRYADDGVRAYSLHPGSVFTNIADRGLEGHRVLGTARRVLAPIEARMLLSPEAGAQTAVYCATTANLASGYYRDCGPAQASSETADLDVGVRLWEDFPLRRS